MTARCPHGWRWFRCHSCVGGWEPPSSEPHRFISVERDGKVIGFYNSSFLEPYAEDPFFSATPAQPSQLYESATFAVEPLTPEMFLRCRTQWYRTLFGRHLRIVE